MKRLAEDFLILLAAYGFYSLWDDVETIIKRRRTKRRWREFEASRPHKQKGGS